MESPEGPIPGLDTEATEELKNDALKEVVGDEFSHVHNRLAPMVWAMCFDLCRENPGNARLNAVLNSLLTTALGFVVALTPEGTEADSEHFTSVRDKFLTNLESMVKDAGNVRAMVSQLGNYEGRHMLLRHQNQAMAQAFQSLTNVILAASGTGVQHGPDPETKTRLDAFKNRKKGNGEAPEA